MESVTHLEVAYLFAVDLILGYHNVLAHQVNILFLLVPFDISFLSEQEYGALVLFIRHEAHLVTHMKKRLCVRHELIAFFVQDTGDDNRHVGQQG